MNKRRETTIESLRPGDLFVDQDRTTYVVIAANRSDIALRLTVLNSRQVIKGTLFGGTQMKHVVYLVCRDE